MSGQTILHSARVGWLTLVRNGALVGTAAFRSGVRMGSPRCEWPRLAVWTVAPDHGMGHRSPHLHRSVGPGSVPWLSGTQTAGRLLLRIETDGRLQSQPSRGRSRHIGQRAGA